MYVTIQTERVAEASSTSVYVVFMSCSLSVCKFELYLQRRIYVMFIKCVQVWAIPSTSYLCHVH